MKKILFLLPVVCLLGALFGTQAKAATYTATSCAKSDVAAAVAEATNGDTVISPPVLALLPEEQIPGRPVYRSR